VATSDVCRDCEMTGLRPRPLQELYDALPRSAGTLK